MRSFMNDAHLSGRRCAWGGTRLRALNALQLRVQGSASTPQSC